MSKTPNADRLIRKRLEEVNRLKGIVTQPSNIVLVTIEDVVEIYHELLPYTLNMLDSVGHLDDELKADHYNCEAIKIASMPDGNTTIKDVHDAIEALIKEQVRLAEEKYNELLYAVGRKYEGETRHETALRYIKYADNENIVAAQLEQEEK